VSLVVVRSTSMSTRRSTTKKRSVAAHVRDRQRAVAEREASRLARPEVRAPKILGHADRKKSAVTSTPSGFLAKQQKNIHHLEKKQEWCGPFAVAREMIAEREEAARRLREAELAEESAVPHPLDMAMEEYEFEKKSKAHPSLQWKGRPQLGTSAISSSNTITKRQKCDEASSSSRSIPSLFDLCVTFLVNNFEYVEGLGNVDSSIRMSVAKSLVSSGKMNGDSFKVIAEDGIEALEILDCCEISQVQLVETLKRLLPAGLRYLLLDQAGRCLGPKTIEAIVASAQRSSLFALSFGGAYLLSDSSASRLVEAVAKTVTSLEFKACPLLGRCFCESIGSVYSTSVNVLVELALEDIPLVAEHIELLGTSALKNVRSLTLRRLEALNDETVSKLLGMTGDRLEGLDLAGCYNLTDATLSSIRRFNPTLQGLTLSGLKLLTAAGLEALFTFVPGMIEPPRLRSLDLGQCDCDAVTDQVLELAARASTKKQVNAADHTSMFGGLVRLDIQGSTLVTDGSMECLAATCTATLKELNVSFCPNITDKGLGYLVEQVDSQLSMIQVWGCAQLTDEFLDGHSRTNDPTIQICGAWMKKSSDRTLR
jgi:hypothetical protein